ncbi:unnamed protein product, partial [Chrysoparadoxa australica]
VVSWYTRGRGIPYKELVNDIWPPKALPPAQRTSNGRAESRPKASSPGNCRETNQLKAKRLPGVHQRATGKAWGAGNGRYTGEKKDVPLELPAAVTRDCMYNLHAQTRSTNFSRLIAHHQAKL